MANFDTAYNHTRKIEGGYADNPSDRGGETYKGVARKKHSSWSGWKLIDAQKNHPRFPAILDEIDSLQKAVRAFYKEKFWNSLSLDAVNSQDIASEMFDTGVNLGTGRAATFLQRILNATNKRGTEYPDLELDGDIGPVTVKVLNGHKRPAQVLKLLNCLQGVHYLELCERDQSQEIFMTGWCERVAI